MICDYVKFNLTEENEKKNTQKSRYLFGYLFQKLVKWKKVDFWSAMEKFIRL